MKFRNWAGTAVFYILICCIFLSVTCLSRGATETIAQRLPLEREHTVIIDPGHGGEDGGATSCTGVLESQFNLQIALRLNDLMHLLGYQTRMIRTTDVSVYTEGETIARKKVSDLRHRVQTVEETDNAVLVSIHQNTFSDSRYSGAQVFYSPTETSRELADTLQKAFAATLNPGSSRQCKKSDGIYLMQHITCPGILVECGFLSNPEEEAMLRNPEYQKKVSSVIATTLGNFLDG